jgi:aspartate/methionine/tyrosine aminotransferase
VLQACRAAVANHELCHTVLQALCKKYGAWLILDNTYESFTGAPHYAATTTTTNSTAAAVAVPEKHVCLEGAHIVNIFSFSKAFGMMGWRLGYGARVFRFALC